MASMSDIVKRTAVCTNARMEVLFKMSSRQNDDDDEYQSAEETEKGEEPGKNITQKMSDKENRERVILYQRSYLEALKTNRRDAKNVYSEILDSIDDRALRAVTIQKTKSGATPYSVISGKRCCYHQFPGGIRLPYQTPVMTRVEDKGISPQLGVIVGVQQYSTSCYKVMPVIRQSEKISNGGTGRVRKPVGHGPE